MKDREMVKESVKETWMSTSYISKRYWMLFFCDGLDVQGLETWN